MSELKPCPFCPDGGDLQLVTFTGGADDVIYYRACGTILKHKIWNTRPIEDELRAEIERLKVRIEELEAAGTILRDCFSLHKPNWLIDKDAIKEWDELTKKECE